MQNTVKIIQWILIGILLGAVSFVYVGKCSTDRENEKLLKALHYLSNIKPDTVERIDTVTIYDKIYVTPKPKPTSNGSELPQVADFGCDSISSTYYSETYKKNGIQFNWEAVSACENDSSKIFYMKFDKIKYPSKTKTITKTIHDTVSKEVPARIKSKFFVYGGAYTNLSSFNGAELGAGYLHKQNWGLMIGPTYLDKNLYLSGKIFVTF